MDSVVEKVIFIICGFLIAVCIVGIVVSIVETQRLADELEKDECKQVSSVTTGKRIYCGKACWRDEMKVEYTCNSGIKIVYR